MMQPDRRETGPDYVHEGKPGLYRMTREVAVNGAWHRNELVVRNPAYGYAEFNTWEQQLRATVQRFAAKQARAPVLRQARQRA